MIKSQKIAKNHERNQHTEKKYLQVGNFNLKAISPRQRCRCLFSKLFIIYIYKKAIAVTLNMTLLQHTCVVFVVVAMRFSGFFSSFLRKPKTKVVNFIFG